MTNLTPTAADNDPFGMSGAHAEPERFEDVSSSPTSPRKSVSQGSAGSKTILGIPWWVAVAAAVLFVLLLTAIVALFLNPSKRTASSVPTARSQTQDASSVTATNATALSSEISSLRASSAAAQDAIQQLRQQVEQLSRNQPPSGLERRLEVVEASQQKAAASLGAMAKKIADSRPFDADISTREGVRIVSVGSGIARIADTSGKEIVLRKGDVWSGLIVREVRSDRSTVVLSDGTVIK